MTTTAPPTHQPLVPTNLQWQIDLHNSQAIGHGLVVRFERGTGADWAWRCHIAIVDGAFAPWPAGGRDGSEEHLDDKPDEAVLALLNQYAVSALEAYQAALRRHLH